MKYYCGIDLGNKKSAICVLSANRKILLEQIVSTDESEIAEALSKFKGLKCIVEAAPLAEWLCTVIEKLEQEVSIVCARKAKRVLSGKKKTDQRDARALAELCRSGWFEPVHRKSEGARELRSYLTARKQLVSSEQSIASSIRGIFRAHGIRLQARAEVLSFFAEAREALKKLPVLAREGIRALLRAHEVLQAEQRKMYRKLLRTAKKQEPFTTLTSIPGVGAATAAAFVATIDDPSRFETSEQVASYLGLVPRIYQSGETNYSGRITKEGDKLMRWLLVEAAHILLTRTKADFALKRWGLELQAAKGAGKARVAVARKLAQLMWELWRNNQRFRYASPVSAV